MTVTYRPRRVGAIVAALAAVVLLPGAVLAHAELEGTTPADGSTVDRTPTDISALFSEALEVDGSGLSLRDPDGLEIASGGIDPEEPARLLITDVPELGPGEYEVRWTAASDDGHVERDTWTFTVTASPTPSPSPSPSTTPVPSPTPGPSADSSATSSPSVSPVPTPVPTPSPAPSASVPPDDGAAGSGSEVILPIIAGLAIVVVAGGFLLSRRGRAT
jgi:copper resistance protein C